ncbi:MAG: DNA protection during starvation protein 2 [Candidatus Omnitrophica bacterium]|nr:DNA protection during starvation protein 2 [Candidatus Omnitrophota bacterium]
MSDINIGLADKSRVGAIEVLSAVLADEYVLYTKTRNFHWNVTGEGFSELHKFFESQYDTIDETIDEVAERIRALGGASAGSLAEFLKAARLKEAPGRKRDGMSMVKELLADHEALARTLRKDVDTTGAKLGDAGTSDFLTGLLEQHEKAAWMLRAYLE